MGFHEKFVAFLREKATSEDSAPHEHEYFDHRSDDEVIRFVFANYRPGEKRGGLLLTPIGNDLARRHFDTKRHPFPKDYRVSPADLLWLENNASWPYYVDTANRATITYDKSLSVKLVLVGGNLKTLREMEGFGRRSY